MTSWPDIKVQMYWEDMEDKKFVLCISKLEEMEGI